ncbi:MAG: hypothetical protein WKI04_09410 [Ferruginibacter sp.]
MNSNWKNALNTKGTESMQIFPSFIKEIPWHTMKPDWAHSVFISGRGYFNATIFPGGEDYATGAVNKDSTVAAIYRMVGVNMKRFRSAVSAKSFDPHQVSIKLFPGFLKTREFSISNRLHSPNDKGFDDWVLMIVSK